MSIKERLKTLQEQRVIAQEQALVIQRQQEQAEKARKNQEYLVWKEKYDQESPKFLAVLEDKIQYLFRYGVGQMLVDFTGSYFPTILYEDQRASLNLQLPDYVRKEISRKGSKERFFDIRHHEWSTNVELPLPFPETWVWDPVLRVCIRKEIISPRARRHTNSIIHQVNMTFDDTRILTISGAEQEFSGKIPLLKAPRTEVLESAFARAFLNPVVIEPKSVLNLLNRTVFEDRPTIVGALVNS